MHAAVVLAIATVLCLVPELKMDDYLKKSRLPGT